ncbi:hypothetical protein KQH27_01180 [bacterium]|nr:hypothetical protein [bacterium]
MQAEVTLPLITTFDCEESSQYKGDLCDGLQWGGAWYFEDYRTQITDLANNKDGLGGRGARFWLGDGRAVNTGTIAVEFPGNQKEVWIRWYMRYEKGFQWDPLQFHKHLYINTGVLSASVIPEFYGDRKYTMVAQKTSNYYQVMTDEGHGWEDIMGGSVSDGEWHCYEIHLKMDTGNSDGIGQLWIDGALRVSNDGVDWSNGDSIVQQGWTYFTFTSNSYSPGNGKGMYVDYDDIAVYNLTPPNRDANGNAFIGLIKTNGSTLELLPPENFRKLN